MLAWDHETERRQTRVEQAQPVVGWNWPIIGAIALSAFIWGLALTAPRWLSWLEKVLQ